MQKKCSWKELTRLQKRESSATPTMPNSCINIRSQAEPTMGSMKDYGKNMVAKDRDLPLKA